MLKKTQLTYRGINQDISNSKRDPGFYYDAQNIRILATDGNTTGSVTNDNGNEFKFSIDQGYQIIGHATIKDYLILFCTHYNNDSDIIYRVSLDTDIPEVLFTGFLNFSVDNFIETESYYESEDVQKIYWVDGVNQLRHINIAVDSTLLPYTQEQAVLFDAVPEVSFSPIVLDSIDYGGLHTAGMIQYGYNLVSKGGSQTMLSPLTQLFPLTKNHSGGLLNEVVGKIHKLKIENVDTRYDIIRLYSVKYTSYNQLPQFHLIAEESISESTFIYSDDGRVISSMTQDEILFLGGIPTIPSAIVSKYNRLILGNIKELYFDVDSDIYDTRAYRFPKNSSITIIKNKNTNYTDVNYTNNIIKFKDNIDNTFKIVPKEHDCICEFGNNKSVSEENNIPPVDLMFSSIILDESTNLRDQYVPSYEFPIACQNLDLTMTVTVAGFNTVTKTYNLNSTESLNVVNSIISKFNSLDFYSDNYTIYSTQENHEYENGDTTGLVLTTYVVDKINLLSMDHSFSIKLKERIDIGIIIEDEPLIIDEGIYYKYNSSTYGATGTNISLEIIQSENNNKRNVLKSNEIYRFGIEFYNKFGQSTPPKWICDLKTPVGNLNGLYNHLKVDIKNISALTSAGVVGWRVLRVERTDQDKTILCQGILNPMIFQQYRDINDVDIRRGHVLAEEGWLKIPSPFMRNTTSLAETWQDGGINPFIYKAQHGVCISEEAKWKSDDSRQEIFRNGNSGDSDTEGNLHLTYQETRLNQFYSPELIFSNLEVAENLKIKLIGSAVNTIDDCAEWAKQFNTVTSFIASESKRYKTLCLFNQSSSKYNQFNQNARIGGTGNIDSQNKYQYYRKYRFNEFKDAQYNIVGSPILTDRGQSDLTYNKESKYIYTNGLGTILTDQALWDKGDPGIISVNSIGNRNITLGINGSDESTPVYKRLESVFAENTLAPNSSGLFELIRVLENQYGGNTYESRSRNTYLRIGDYKSIGVTTNLILEAGDTFVGNFRFARIMANTTSVLDSKYYEMTEIVEFPVESSIDINNRSDMSDSWDSVFMPTFDQYHNYNRVYSQQPTFNATISTPFTFVERKVFENRLLASKVKIAGQIVDNWTDIQLNEELYVDGNYGGIVKLIKNNDLVACFQNNAVSALLIQPRVQTVGTDGTSIELGRGTILYDFKYITTTSGGTNSQCIFKSPSSIYYIDAINRSINRINSQGIVGLSDTNGLHSFAYNNLNESLVGNNHVLGCFDQITNDAYFTAPGFTIAFNEQTDSFTSRYSFNPGRYISTYKGLYTENIRNGINASSIWRHNTGVYGNYYETQYDSTITLLIAPEPDVDCVLNNLEFKSEVYLNGVDQPTQTLNKIRAWNNYQDSGTQNLTVGSNMRRKYRDWNCFIPRVSGHPLQRIRNSWNFVQLDYTNNNNKKLILHDILASYDAIYTK